MRGFLVGALVVVGIVLLPLADLAVWVDRQLLDTSRFTSLADDILDEPDVRTALADQVAVRLAERYPEIRGREDDVRGAAVVVAGSDAFDSIFNDAVGRMHQQLVDREDRLVLDLDAMVPLVREQLPESVAAQIPSSTGLEDVEVVDRDDVPVLWTAVELVQRAALAFAVVVLLLFALAILLARSRGAALCAVGGISAALLLFLVMVVEFGSSLLDDFSGDAVQQDAFDAAGSIVVGSFVTQTVILAIVFVVVAVAGILIVSRSRGNERPAEWA